MGAVLALGFLALLAQVPGPACAEMTAVPPVRLVLEREFDVPDAIVRALAFRSDETLVVGTSDRRLLRWDVALGAEMASAPLPPSG